MNGRAADVEAVAATGALVFDHLEGFQLVVILDQHAGLIGDDDRHLGHLHFFADGLEQHRQLVRIDDVNAFRLDAQRFDQLGEIDARRLVVVNVATVARIVLATGHADRAIVEQQDGDVALVVNHVEQALHPHVQEGGIADHGDHALVLVGFTPALVETERNAHRGPHGNRGVQRIPGMAGTQRITADIAGNGQVADLRQRVINAEVRAGHAHRRRPREYFHCCGQPEFRGFFAKQTGDGRFQHIR